MAEKKVMRAKKQEEYAPVDVAIPKRLGGGTLKEYVIREIPSRKVIHYALAYINPLICSVDNGRVLGYDNSHGYSHRHFMGTVKPVQFTNYEELSQKFDDEWMSIAVDYVNGDLK